jgi:hypothetical protein
LKKAILVLCGLGLLAWIGYKLLPNEERAIRKQLDRLVETVSIKPGEGNLARLSKANQLPDFFIPEVTINLEGIGYNVPVITSRSDLREAALAVHSQFRQAEFQIDGLHVAFAPDNKRAATAYVLITGQIDLEPDRFGQQLRMELQKVEHRWMIASVSVVEGLR